MRYVFQVQFSAVRPITLGELHGEVFCGCVAWPFLKFAVVRGRENGMLRTQLVDRPLHVLKSQNVFTLPSGAADGRM